MADFDEKEHSCEETGSTSQYNSTPNRDLDNSAVPGSAQAVASMVLGICSIGGVLIGFLGLLSIVLGIIGVVLSSEAKAKGNNSGYRIAGFVLSLVGLIFGSLMFVACVACI